MVWLSLLWKKLKEKDSEEEEGNPNQYWKTEGDEWDKVSKRELASSNRKKSSQDEPGPSEDAPDIPQGHLC